MTASVIMRVVVGIVLLLGGVVSVLIAGTARWQRATNAAVDELSSGLLEGAGAYRESLTEGLPAPAARYFRKALKDGQPIVVSAVATQEAEFFINGAWRPLRATQHFATTPPGFVWDARIAMAALLPASVRDAYVNGRGAMQASLFGVYTLADQVDKPELNAGALQRYLGEAVWFPTALLPSAAVTWTPRDDRSAMATLRDGDATVALTFEFDEHGLVTSIRGDRYKERDGAYAIAPWQIVCGDHAERGGMIIPQRCEVAWVSGGRAEPYWRGRVTDITYSYN